MKGEGGRGWKEGAQPVLTPPSTRGKGCPPPAPHVPLRQRIAQACWASAGTPGCLCVGHGLPGPTPGFATTRETIQGDSRPAQHKEGIPRALDVGLWPPRVTWQLLV